MHKKYISDATAAITKLARELQLRDRPPHAVITDLDKIERYLNHLRKTL